MVREKIKLFSMFSGFGGAEFALKKIGIPFECVGYSEIDKYAIQCYEQNHNYKVTGGELSYNVSPENYGDCTKINPSELPDFDLLTGGFPCQAFSVAGNGLGEQDTRGTLFHEIIRIAEVKKPRYILLENVKGLTFKKHKETFEKILSELDRIGYSVHWQILNSKEHGIPQNRERVFFVCFRDSEDNEKFEGFPEKEELEIFVKDILEDEVDEKYILSENQLKYLMNSKDIEKGFSKINPEIAGTQTARQYASWRGNFVTKNKRIGQILQSPVNKTNLTYELTGDTPSGISRQGDRIFNLNSHAPTLNCTQKEYMFSNPNELTIRKLTPKECFRLMGFLNDEINLDGLSNTQKYRLAGNGWEINLVSKIFERILK